MILHIEHTNNSGDVPHYIGEGRVREAGPTSVQFITDDLLVACDLVAQRMYLIKFDLNLETWEILQTLHTQFNGEDVITDLLSWGGRRTLVTSNCQQSSLSLYRMKNQRISYWKDLPIKDVGGFCHGVQFLPKGESFVACTCTTHSRQIYFIEIRGGRIVYQFRIDGWLPKDICFFESVDRDPRWGDESLRNTMCVVSTNAHAASYEREAYDTKLSLVEYDITKKWFKILDEVVIPQCHVDCVVRNGNQVIFNNQLSDTLFRYTREGDKFVPDTTLTGYDYPHGIDIRGDMMAVTNYGNNTIEISQL